MASSQGIICLFSLTQNSKTKEGICSQYVLRPYQICSLLKAYLETLSHPPHERQKSGSGMVTSRIIEDKETFLSCTVFLF